MRRSILFLFCFILLIAGGAYADIITLDPDYLIGSVTQGLPTNEANEAIYSQYIVDLYNGDATNPNYGDDVYALSVGSLVPDAPLPDVILAGYYSKVGGPYYIPGGYEYLYAKFGAGAGSDDNHGELYYLGGREGELVDYPGALSHITLFNPVSVPEPSLIMLLGLGLGAVGLVSRRKK